MSTSVFRATACRSEYESGFIKEAVSEWKVRKKKVECAERWSGRSRDMECVKKAIDERLKETN